MSSYLYSDFHMTTELLIFESLSTKSASQKQSVALQVKQVKKKFDVNMYMCTHLFAVLDHTVLIYF